MNDFVEFVRWSGFIHWSVVVIGLLVGTAAMSKRSFNIKTDNTQLLTIIIGIYSVFLFGALPIPYTSGGDRAVYAYLFEDIKNGIDYGLINKDAGFVILVYFISSFADMNLYFYIIAAIYIFFYVIGAKRMVKGDSLWLFVACLLSMGFTSYAVNTLRAGIAISIIFAGLTFYKSWVKMGLFFALALSIHFSMIIPIAMIVAAKLYDRPKLYFYLWCAAVVLSFAAGSYFNNLFEGLVEDDRTMYLIEDNGKYKTGFRIDFIIYSVVPMIIGYFYIVKKRFSNRFYSLIFNAYILANIFWVLIIRANFSDRFAYLSWFLIPIVLVYPLLYKSDIVRSPGLWLGTVLLGETLFKIMF